MAESERRRLITSTPHLSPDEIVQRTFTTSFRGYTEAEVRAFLKRVSEELVVDTRARGRAARRRSTRSRSSCGAPARSTSRRCSTRWAPRRPGCCARRARPPTRSASKAEERAAQLLEEAARGRRAHRRARPRSSRASRTDEAVAQAAALVGDAEARAAEIESAMEAYAEEQRARAEREAEELIEAARQQGREMLDEAKATRERVLADLFRRRTLLQAQIEALRGGRDNLLDAYRVVKRTFLEATERARAGRGARRGRARGAHDGESREVDQPTTPSTPSRRRRSTPTRESTPATGRRAARRADADASSAAGDRRRRADRPEPGRRRLAVRAHPRRPGRGGGRAGARTPATGAAATDAARRPPATDGRDAAEPRSAGDRRRGAAEPKRPDAGAAVAPRRRRGAERASTRGGRSAPRSLDPLLVTLAKRAKRAAQDDQNALLDAVRRHKGRPTSAQVLAPEPDAARRRGPRCCATRSTRRTAPAAPRRAASRPAPTTRSRARRPQRSCYRVRERIAAAIDAGEEGDTGGLVERIGARFREWKNQSLEEALVDALTVAWSRGVYDASPDGAVLRWIPVDRGPLRRLRRQRARADGQGLVVPDRSAAPARASGLPVPAGARRRPQPARSERVTR